MRYCFQLFFFLNTELNTQAIEEINMIMQSHKEQQVMTKKYSDFDDTSEEANSEMDDEKAVMEDDPSKTTRSAKEYQTNRFSKYILKFQKKNTWEMDDRFERQLMSDFKTNAKGNRQLDVLIVKCVEDCML